VDVDGTLMEGGQIDSADAAALRDAAKAGAAVCLCTGRSWKEVEPIWRRVELPAPHAPVICVGGALVVDPDTGKSLYSRAFDRPTADELSRAMRELGYPVMGLVDAWREGFDYLMLGDFERNPLYAKFFEQRRPRWRAAGRLGENGSPPVLRISLLAEGADAPELARRLEERFAGRIEIQAIHLRHSELHIVESFRAGADKFTAMVYVGQGLKVPPSAMAAIGDDYNDVAMLRGAGASAAPADAPEPVRRAAGMVLAPRGGGAVADFVRRLGIGTENA
jgi:hypothetical protein